MENKSPFKLGEYPKDIRECPTIPEFVDGVRSVAHLAALYDALMIKPVDFEHILLAGQTLTVRLDECLYNIRSTQSLRHMRDYVRASLIRAGVNEIGVDDLGTLLSYTDGSSCAEVRNAKLDLGASLEAPAELSDSVLSKGDVETLEPFEIHPTLVISGATHFRTLGSKHSSRTEFHLLDSKYDPSMVLVFDDIEALLTFRDALDKHIEFSKEMQRDW